MSVRHIQSGETFTWLMERETPTSGYDSWIVWSVAKTQSCYLQCVQL